MKADAEIEFARAYPSPNPHVKLTEITYWSEGIRVKGMLAQPIATGQYEGVLYLRGGIQSIGMVRPARIAEIASQGFVVFAPYYRGNRGGEGKDEFGGKDVYDVLHGITLLKNYCLRDRVHLFAFSRGGIMALWAAILRDDLTSVVTWGGVSSLRLTYKERTDMRRMMKRVIGGTPTKIPDVYDQRSAIRRSSEINIPVLIIHGALDDNVKITHAHLLEKSLKGHGKRVETWYYPDLTHFFPGILNHEVLVKALNWMREK